jgi:hypothetical protein
VEKLPIRKQSGIQKTLDLNAWAQSQYPTLDPNYFINQSSGAPSIASPSGADYLGTGLSAYSAMTDSFFTAAGVDLESLSFMGIRYGAPALLSDVPGGIGGTIGVFQTYNAYSNGDYLEASKAGGATLGGIAGAEFGAYIGAFGGPFSPVTVPVGAVVGGVIGAYLGSSAGGSIYNNGFMPLDRPSVPPPPPGY